jgi:hypothetical protein
MTSPYGVLDALPDAGGEGAMTSPYGVLDALPDAGVRVR